MSIEATIIIPTLNEEKNIQLLIELIIKESILEQNITKILVVDDGSTDNTVKIVRELSKKNKNILLLNRKNEKIKGITASVLHASEFITTKYFIVIDGDLQHPPEKIKEIIEKLKNSDIVVACREKIENNWPIHRKIMSLIATFLAKIKLKLIRITVKDPMSGFFGVKTELFTNQIKKNNKRFILQGYKVLFDFLKTIDEKITINQINYNFGSRKKGSSKIKLKHTYYFLKSLIK